jgi:hypothetical protein
VLNAAVIGHGRITSRRMDEMPAIKSNKLTLDIVDTAAATRKTAATKSNM